MADYAVINYSAPPAVTTLRTQTARIIVTADLLDGGGNVVSADDYPIDLRTDPVPSQLRTNLEDLVRKLAQRAGRIA